MTALPDFNSGGFHRDQLNNIGVFLVDTDGVPYVASGGTGGGGGVVQMQFREGAAWVNAPGTAARGLLVDQIAGGTDGQVGLPARSVSVAGYDGTNLRAIKTSAAGVVQVDILSGAGGTQYTEGDTDTTITGTALLWEDAADTLRAVSAAKPLPVAQQGTVTVTGALTDTQLRATPVPVSGTVTATGPLTDAQLRASAVPVDSELTTADLDAGAGTDTRAVVGLLRAESGGALLVGSANPLPVTGPLTDTQLRASAVPVSGPLTDTQLRASAVPVSLAANQSVNVAQMAGTATDTNSGNKSAGTQRIVIATDQPQLTNALKVDGSAVTQPVSGTVTASNVTGNVASDGVDSGNPVKVGAQARTTDITAVASADRVDNVATILGKQVIQPYSLPGALTNGKVNLTTTAAADVIAAPGAGIRLYITEVTLTNAHATVSTKVDLRDGTTAKKTVYCVAAGGGAVITFPAPLRLTANTAFTAACGTTGADVDVSASGYTAAE